jgi:hypothetical protein
MKSLSHSTFLSKSSNGDKAVALTGALGASQSVSQRLKEFGQSAFFTGSTSDKAAAFRFGVSVSMTPLCARRVLARDNTGKAAMFRKFSASVFEGSLWTGVSRPSVTGLVDFVPLRPSSKLSRESSRQGSLELPCEAGADSWNPPPMETAPAEAAPDPPQAHRENREPSLDVVDHCELLAPADGTQDPSPPVLPCFGNNVSEGGSAPAVMVSEESSSSRTMSASLQSATMSFGAAAVMAPSPPRDHRPLHASPRTEGVLGEAYA